MSDYKVIKIPQAEFDKLGGLVWAAFEKNCLLYFYHREPAISIADLECAYSIDGMILSGCRNAVIKLLQQDEPLTTIFKFEPIAKDEFTLDMLESGKHAVKLRDGMTYLVVGCKLLRVSEQGGYYIHLEGYDNDMLHREVDDVDIVEVFEYPYSPKNLEQYQSVWERKEEQSDSNELLIESIDKCINKLHKNTELFQELSQSHASDLSELNKLLGKNK